jgi:hypothetical protein
VQQASAQTRRLRALIAMEKTGRIVQQATGCKDDDPETARELMPTIETFDGAHVHPSNEN